MTTVAVEDVWRDMHAPLLRFIARRVSDPRDAEDVLQDVMVRIQRHAGEMDRFDHLGAWVQQVTRSAIVDFYRRRAARPELAAGSGAEIDEFRASDAVDAMPTPAVRAELARCLRPLVARLPDKYREALELTEFEGLSQVEAAERLGLSTSGMKARVQRGRGQLRDLLLECCCVDLDRRGGVAAYESRAGGCGGCQAP
jgi:RNA polymerase sigma-70 factor (ECF subfamily)